MATISLPVPSIETVPNVKIAIPIGACMDIPTGAFLTGKYGDSLLCGGYMNIMGFVGKNNTYKSSIADYATLSAMNKVFYTTPTYNLKYDTESNVREERIVVFSKNFSMLKDINLFDAQNIYWRTTDKTVQCGDEWFDDIKKWLESKVKLGAKGMLTTPFLARDYKTFVKVLVPSFGGIDTITLLSVKHQQDMVDKHKIMDKETNTLEMQQGRFKTRLMDELPTVLARASHYMTVNAHYGMKLDMSARPGVPPPKESQFQKPGEQIKGVGTRYSYTAHVVYNTTKSVAMHNSSTDKSPKYPKVRGSVVEKDTDLNEVTMQIFRNKGGPTGIIIKVVVSQSEGVLPTLTEFNFLRDHENFGFSKESNLTTWSMALYPEVKFTRTTIREKIAADPLLCRAINITSEILQMIQLGRHSEVMTDMTTLYDDLIKMGFDWKELLATRGFWLFDNHYEHPIKHLSSLDFLNIRAGLYVPYWLQEKK